MHLSVDMDLISIVFLTVSFHFPAWCLSSYRKTCYVIRFCLVFRRSPVYLSFSNLNTMDKIANRVYFKMCYFWSRTKKYFKFIIVHVNVSFDAILLNAISSIEIYKNQKTEKTKMIKIIKIIKKTFLKKTIRK